MSYGSNAIEIIPSSAAPDVWAQAQNDDNSGIWATEDDYRAWSSETNADQHAQSRAGSEQPPGKKSRSSSSQLDGNSTNKSRALGKMFYKTKLCCKFRAGTCPYVTNCNFAHGMEELRKPPPNWQEIVAAHEEATEQREEHHIPILNSSSVAADGQRSYKGRHCKRFYTEEGCPYGDSCTFLHDEQSKSRESVAISLSPTVSGGATGGAPNAATLKPSNWKTRMCNKWEVTGYCPFGSKCHFAHGAAELNNYGGQTDTDRKDVSAGSKQAGASVKVPNEDAATGAGAPHGDVYHLGATSQRNSLLNQRQVPVQRHLPKWRGLDKIRGIYGDWIDENE